MGFFSQPVDALGLARLAHRSVSNASLPPAGAKEGFFSQLVDAVADHMGDAYPELNRARDQIRQALMLGTHSCVMLVLRGICATRPDDAVLHASRLLFGPGMVLVWRPHMRKASWPQVPEQLERLVDLSCSTLFGLCCGEIIATTCDTCWLLLLQGDHCG